MTQFGVRSGGAVSLLALEGEGVVEEDDSAGDSASDADDAASLWAAARRRISRMFCKGLSFCAAERFCCGLLGCARDTAVWIARKLAPWSFRALSSTSSTCALKF
eukprot:TRINITY_DN7480_c0_g1_i2.p1 TRINITY_DN7480_c0_g1~~TRINITY_DN7480_c0_g1_i2.p1  ORF type:complete len:105 (-),score=2.61 TRINITY_DN7480_c0_g1_i2:364-678(-)